MTERPILFSGPMVKAILAGRKTQTRRVMENQPAETPALGKFKVGKCSRYQKNLPFKMVAMWGDDQGCICPYGVPGDRLWVRETCLWSDVGFEQSVAYRADGEPGESWVRPIRWRPAIHMPRRACRLVLEVTGVRVERLQDIAEVDAIDEGVLSLGDQWFAEHFGEYLERLAVSTARHEKPPLGPSPRERYRALWDSLNAKRGFGWKVNPYVWVVEFKPVDRTAAMPPADARAVADAMESGGSDFP